MAEYNKTKYNKTKYNKTPLETIYEVDEVEIARLEAKNIEDDRKFTVMMGGEELFATTIYIRNINKAIKKRIEYYNDEIKKGQLTEKEVSIKLERFVNALQRGLVLFKRKYNESLELRNDGTNYSKYLSVPDLSELNSTFKTFFDHFLNITKQQLKNYIEQPLTKVQKTRKAEGLQQEILELANAMLKKTSDRVLSINEGIIVGGKKTKQKLKNKRTKRRK
jgi:hypothetical protein